MLVILLAIILMYSFKFACNYQRFFLLADVHEIGDDDGHGGGDDVEWVGICVCKCC